MSAPTTPPPRHCKYGGRAKWHMNVLLDTKISSSAKVLAGILCLKYLNQDTHDAFPAQSTLATDMGLTSDRRIPALVRELVEAGFLYVEQGRGGRRGGRSSRYWLTFPAFDSELPEPHQDVAEPDELKRPPEGDGTKSISVQSQRLDRNPQHFGPKSIVALDRKRLPTNLTKNLPSEPLTRARLREERTHAPPALRPFAEADPVRWQRWFADCDIEADEGAIRIFTGSKFARDEVRIRYLDELEASARRPVHVNLRQPSVARLVA